MPRQQYYEPQIGDTERFIEMRGFPVSIGGQYVLLDDVVTALRAYADANEEPAVNEAATWLISGESRSVTEHPTDPRIAPVVAPAAEDPAVDRIEIYPDNPEDPRPKWYARACSPDGDILHTTGGSFDQQYVIYDAQQRWPNKPTHLVHDYSVDTVWEENDPGGIRSPHTKRRRPSPKRLWAQP